ncbi:MAG: 3-deoxy-8-phosphooctulonate synthase [Desulfovibrio sp.]|nr:3-deoxy-8-phosphooctulonate synthase [Desulfovibrio sp.]
MQVITLSRPKGDGVFLIGNNQKLFIIAGPCVIESREQTLRAAETLLEITTKLNLPLIFKSSFDKANRSSLQSYRGVGLEEGLSILSEVRKLYNLPVITDVHSPEQAALAGSVVDMLQVPAFLCRQTDLLLAAASTGKPVNIKKGQFLAPWDMEQVLKKATSCGNQQICLCERGASFGYNNLVVDMRSLEIMKRFGQPVIFDATHSVQLPGAMGGSSGGQREFVPALARAAVACGVAGVFFEAHHNPEQAPCDGPNMLPFKDLPKLFAFLQKLDADVKSYLSEQ